MEENGKWSGWAVTTPSLIGKLPPLTPLENFTGSLKKEKVSQFLSMGSMQDLIESNQRFLHTDNPSILFPTTAKKIEHGVWISKAVTIEPGAKIVPPIFIGENTEIKAGAKIGPHAVIENHCVISEGSEIENSLICKNSFVGENLEIKHCVVDRNCLINTLLGSKIQIKEDFILSESTPPSLKFNLFEKLLAVVLLILFLPLYCYQRLACKKEEEVVALPASLGRTFTLTTFDAPFPRLSWLIPIIKGKLHFVGVTPRTPAEVEKLPEEWRRLYLTSKAGLITLTSVHDELDEQYAKDAYYAVNAGFLFDLKVMLGLKR